MSTNTTRKIDRVAFYTEFKKRFGRFTTKQYEGFEVIFAGFEKRSYTDIRWLAYILATVWHETANTMRPIEEYGKGKGYKYGKQIKRSGVAYKWPMKIFYGRGYVQLTWFENYELMGKLLGLPLLEKPELACDPSIAAEILFEGMTKGASSFGDFTGKCLEMYFNSTAEDAYNARRIINGIDRAKKIEGEYYQFKACLKWEKP